MGTFGQSFVTWLMRAGYGARGIVYLIIGSIALFAAIKGGEAEGSTGALEYLVRQPFGVILLSVVAIGLFAYTLWRFAGAALDLETDGLGLKGVASRIGQFMSGVTHIALGVSAVTIIAKGARPDTSDTAAENWTAYFLSQPFGRYLVIAVGLITIGVGFYMVARGMLAFYKNDIRRTATTMFLAPAVRFGLYAHGFVLWIIGGLITWAAVTFEPETAAGLGEALRILETQSFGRILLGVTGAGLMAFALYCFVMSRYRFIPKYETPDTPTLASLMLQHQDKN